MVHCLKGFVKDCSSANRTKTAVDGSWLGRLSRKNLRALKPSWCGITVYKDLTSMVKKNLWVPRKFWKIWFQGCHDTIKKTRDELGLWIIGKKYMTDVRDMVDMSFLAVSGRSPVADKSMNGLRNVVWWVEVKSLSIVLFKMVSRNRQFQLLVYACRGGWEVS
jgi:hypothetical protein